MPASGGDPVAGALRINFNGTKANSLDNVLEASNKRVLLTRIEFEPATNYQSTVLTGLKGKYVVINTKHINNNGKAVNGVNGVNNVSKKPRTSLPLPRVSLFPLERVQLGYRGSLNVGSGMMNLGNTCYLNSTLQALFHVPAFVNWLLSEPAHQKCEQNADYQAHPEDITCAIIKTFKCSQQKTGISMKPICIYSKLKAICKHLSQGSQEDAHEFMRYLLECLEKSFLNKVQGHSLENWSKETTPINQIFGGYIRTEVVCLVCHAVSTTFQHFQDLSLDIRRASTLDDALTGYFDRERLPEGEDAYKCENCCRKVAATKKFAIERPPNVLCVQLKRFSMMNGKLTKQVQLPEYLDLTRFISASINPRHPVKYRLVSMVTHMGQSVNCGHYTAIALAANGVYYQFDDGSVRQIPLASVLNMSAYLVLYELERPFPSNNPRTSASVAETSAHKESESASVGGSGYAAKSWNSSSPTAGSPAPRTSPVPKETPVSRPTPSHTPRPLMTSRAPTQSPTPKPAVAQPSTTSLVPYESDVDSDAENKDGECKNGLWKVTPANPRPSAPAKNAISSWRVTDIQQPKCADSAKGEAKSPDHSNGNHNHQNGSREDKSDSDKRRDIVTQLSLQNHRGYGSNNVRSWNGTQSNMEREVENERRESQKRSYDEMYNNELDRGKSKKKRIDYEYNVNGRIRCNMFQQRANEQNAWRHKNRYNDYNPKGGRFGNGNGWNGFRRNYNRYNNHRNRNYSRY